FGDAAYLAADPHAELLFVIVAAIPLIDMDRRVSIPVSCSNSVITGPSVWPSNGLPCSALLCSTNWPPLGLVAGWQSTLCSRTRTALGPYPCRCIRPRGRAAHIPSARAADDPESVPATPGRGGRRSAPEASRPGRSCGGCRG